MKTTRTTKTWIIAIICLLSLCLGAILATSIGDFAFANTRTSSGGTSFELSLSDEMIDVKETFTAKFSFDGKLNDYFFVENGVTAVKTKDGVDFIVVELLADADECNFVLHFSFDGTEYQSSTIYTYSTAGKVFISDSSEDTAWLMGLTYKLEQGRC